MSEQRTCEACGGRGELTVVGTLYIDTKQYAKAVQLPCADCRGTGEMLVGREVTS